jgi:hypothetical protein
VHLHPRKSTLNFLLLLLHHLDLYNGLKTNITITEFIFFFSLPSLLNFEKG